MKHPFVALLVRWSVLALGVTLATRLVDGISYNDIGTLVAVVALLSLFNAVLKPLLVLFGLPFIVLTLGLGVLLINALLLWLVGSLLQPAFRVDGFGSAFWGALIISLTNLFVSVLLAKKNVQINVTRGVPSAHQGNPPPAPGPRKIKDDDVIDI
ncbi:phage holin family protein [Rariglobus hedericola]|uniref:Phage holin family protein n=1 Tax=Rariglobus hedericola TaxID=2597822 RepID=A0A556QMS3_9BACT|nr:phage holin family protein [Rariglobus hedericola]TSJ77946.1 phage holin family protein [Rariglobus hedericola]